MTKKEYFAEIVAVATEVGREDLVEFANKEIELLNKRNSKDSKAAKEKAEANAKLGEDIVAAVAEFGAPARTMEIAAAVGISPQKATPILKALVESGKLVEKVEKKVKTFALPEVAEGDAE